MSEKYKQLIKRFKNDYFRMIIFGCTGSGKSYFLAKQLYPIIKKNYDNIVVFTRKFNATFYEKQIPNCSLITDKDTILDSIKRIKETQEMNIKKLDNLGCPIYKTNILFIFDDIVDEKLFKDDEFKEIFFNLRHLQISVILLSQISNTAINTSLKANCQFFVIFKLNDMYQKRFAMQLIEQSVMNEDPSFTDNDIKTKSKKIMISSLYDKKYGKIIIDDQNNYYI